ncbi:MAG: ATP synthase F0 subunit C [Puniceicoccales bacterium]|jgi:F-type H+-transporting ATPase subunit c|nr:ATP synthase F0 subunit C [Puniceicoccales bacterium]
MLLADTAIEAAKLAQANLEGAVAIGQGLATIGKGLGATGAALGVGIIGLKAAEGVARNPGASTKILVQAIIGMALAEGLGILAVFVL